MKGAKNSAQIARDNVDLWFAPTSSGIFRVNDCDELTHAWSRDRVVPTCLHPGENLDGCTCAVPGGVLVISHRDSDPGIDSHTFVPLSELYRSCVGAHFTRMAPRDGLQGGARKTNQDSLCLAVT